MTTFFSGRTGAGSSTDSRWVHCQPKRLKQRRNPIQAAGRQKAGRFSLIFPVPSSISSVGALVCVFERTDFQAGFELVRTQRLVGDELDFTSPPGNKVKEIIAEPALDSGDREIDVFSELQGLKLDEQPAVPSRDLS